MCEPTDLACHNVHPAWRRHKLSGLEKRLLLFATEPTGIFKFHSCHARSAFEPMFLGKFIFSSDRCLSESVRGSVLGQSRDGHE